VDKSVPDPASSSSLGGAGRRKAIYTKPVHKEFERAWLDGKKPELNESPPTGE